MQAPDIKKLLSRKKFNGPELGKVLIHNKAREMEQWKYGKPAQTPLFTNEELQHMKAGLKTAQDRLEYNEYAFIYNLTTDLWNDSMADFNRLFVLYWKYTEYLKKLDCTEKALWDLEKCPLIISRKDYEALAAPVEKANAEELRAPSYYMCETLYKWLKAYEAGEKVPAAVKKALGQLKKQKCTSSRVLDNFSMDLEAGKWTDAEGHEVDMTQEVTTADMFKKADFEDKNGKKPSMAEMAEKMVLASEKEEYIGHPKDSLSLDELTEKIKETQENLETMQPDARAMFWGANLHFFGVEATEEMYRNLQCDIEAEFRNEDREKHLFKAAFYHEPEKKKKLTKLEALKNMGRYFGWYDYVLVGDEEQEEIDPADQLQAFTEDYPELYTLLLAEIEAQMPACKGMTMAELVQPLISIGELQQQGVAAYDHCTKPTDEELAAVFTTDTYTGLNKHYRVLKHGFAIVEADTAKDPVEDTVAAAIFDDTMKNKGKAKDYLIMYRTHYEGLIKKLHAHNKLLQIICRLYDINFLYENASFPLNTFSKFDKNNLLETPPLLLVYGHLYGTWEQVKQKAAFISEVYPSKCFDAENECYDPAEERVEEVEEILQKAMHTQSAGKILEMGTDLVKLLLGLKRVASYGLVGGLHD